MGSSVGDFQRNGLIVKAEPVAACGQSKERKTDADQAPGKPSLLSHLADIVDDK